MSSVVRDGRLELLNRCVDSRFSVRHSAFHRSFVILRRRFSLAEVSSGETPAAAPERGAPPPLFPACRICDIIAFCTRNTLLNQPRERQARLRKTRVQGALSLFYFSPSLSARSGLFVAVISAKNGALTNNTATAGSFRFSLPIFFGCAGRTGHHRKFEVRRWKFEVGSQFC